MVNKKKRNRVRGEGSYQPVLISSLEILKYICRKLSNTESCTLRTRSYKCIAPGLYLVDLPSFLETPAGNN